MIRGGSPSDETEVPNLDCMTLEPAELREWARAVLDDPEAAAERWGAGRGAAPVALALAVYAQRKAAAVSMRLAGEIAGAVAHERAIDATYANLPAWARW